MKIAKRFAVIGMTVVMTLQGLAPATPAIAQELPDIALSAYEDATRAASSVRDFVGQTTNSVTASTEDATTDSGSKGESKDQSGAEASNSSSDSGKTDGEGGDSGQQSSGTSSGEGETQESPTDEPADDSDQAKNEDVASTTAVANGITITTIDDLKTQLEKNGASDIAISGDSLTSFSTSSAEAIKVLSHANPELYKTVQVEVTSTGAGADTVDLASNSDISFDGLGSADVPFEGSIHAKAVTADKTKIRVARTLYNGLKVAQSTICNIIWLGDTTYAEPMLASTLVGDGSLTANIDIADPINQTGTDTVKEDSPAVSSAVLGATKGNVSVDASYSYSGTRKKTSLARATDTGVLVNNVDSGTLTVGKLDGINLDGATVSSTGGNAGLFVGYVAPSAGVTMGAYTLANEVTVTTTTESGKSAGGLVGECGDGATVTLNGAIDFSKLTVKGRAASGGLIGKATKLNLVQNNAPFTCAKQAGDSNSAASGGFIGYVSFGKEQTFTNNDEVKINDQVKVGAAGSCPAGSAIGWLFLDDTTDGNVTFNGGTYNSRLADSGAASYGGIVGAVSNIKATAGRTTLTINSAKTSIANDSTPKVAGGLVGWTGKSPGSETAGAVLIANNNEISCATGANKGSFGGVVGVHDNNSVLDINGLKVSSATISQGSGTVAESWGATIRLSGTTDFSDMQYSEKDTVGQIACVSLNNPSLIFACGDGSGSGWKLIRSAKSTKIDDIASISTKRDKGYGEVIRLGTTLSADLIKLSDVNHQPIFNLDLGKDQNGIAVPDIDPATNKSYGNQLNYSLNGPNELKIGTADEFACLAVAIQTRGQFSGVYKIGTTNYTRLFSSTLTIQGDIDLSGTGLVGLTQDYDNSPACTFKINGNGHKISLAVGEAYGTRGDGAVSGTDEGNGKIYYHTGSGLIGNDGGCTVNNLEIVGSITVRNSGDMYVGSFASRKSSGTTSLSGLKIGTTINAGRKNGSVMLLGGALGVMEAGQINFDNGCVLAGSIETNVDTNEDTVVGGAIGRLKNQDSTVNVNGLTISESMNVSASGQAPIVAGGFIADVETDIRNGDKNKQINIKGLTFDGADLQFGNNTNTTRSTGGYLGYKWGGATVNISGTSAKPGLVVKGNSTLVITGAPYVGGLVYRASGFWEIGDFAIDFSGASITSEKPSTAEEDSTLGLLVCRGGADDNTDSLYLETTANWSSAYKVGGLTLTGFDDFKYFDEWVGSTCAADKSVSGCGVNGVVSLKTTGGKLDMSGDASKRNSYLNRTDLGRQGNHQVNGRTRYYYNLDSIRNAVPAGSGSQLDTPEKLLLWSVWRYADDNIKPYFTNASTDTLDKVVIGGTDKNNTAELDMTGYSYYPVDVSNTNVEVKNARVTFCNSKIEKEETGNKLTSNASQHMNMHVGLLRNFNCANTTQTNSKKFTVTNTELKGTVGIDVEKGASGALLSGTAQGSGTGATSIASIILNGVTLTGFKIQGLDSLKAGKSAPLLVNAAAGYSNLTVTTLRAYNGYDTDTKAATSLFGDLGGKDATMVTASFSDIKTRSWIGTGDDSAIFTHASLLESYSFAKNGSSNATYNFYKKERDAKNVTFGREIDAEGEYKGDQLRYYDEDLQDKGEGLVQDFRDRTANADTPEFGNYLPYVYKSSDNGPHEIYHEIKVNQRVEDLVEGCGTYGDPYKVTTSRKLITIANYINTMSTVDGWKITIAKNQGSVCARRAAGGNTQNEVTYTYSSSAPVGAEWIPDNTADEKVQPISNETMHRYIQSAYLSIEPLSDDNVIKVDTTTFKGIGNESYPFRGVIVGNLKNGVKRSTIQIEYKDGEFKGLIPYSYGSVVSDVDIKYTGTTNNVSAAGINDTTGVPQAFFGGVIGCVLGGDNIIDNAKVSVSGNYAVSSNSHLTPIGGYIGAIAGGGVVFRHMTDKSAGWHKDGTSRYDNPYVGRVIDGYAFTEGNDCSLDNTDRNYKINNLTNDDRGLVTTDTKFYSRNVASKNATTVTVSNPKGNPKGLLILSAIINSGAGSGPTNSTNASWGKYWGSRAYQGCSTDATNGSYRFGNNGFGKVRNADYDQVGKGVGGEGSDFVTSVKDDMLAPGNQTGKAPYEWAESDEINSPYLVQRYANWATGYVCAADITGIDLRFAEGSYDMTPYGTGYLGLSGRYYSNACFSGEKSTDRERVTPMVATIAGEGEGANFKVEQNVKEYSDDAYMVNGVGALFSTVSFANDGVSGSIASNDNSIVKNISFADCNLSYNLTNANGDTVDGSGRLKGVGCLAGVTAVKNFGVGFDSNINGKYKGVSLKNCTVKSASAAGGLLGDSGTYRLSTDENDISDMIATDGVPQSPVQLIDTNYSNLAVAGATSAGGYVGTVGGSNSSVGVWVSQGSKTVADSSTISVSDEGGFAGGVFGSSGQQILVNVDQNGGGSYGTAKINNVTVSGNTSSDGATGGFVGKASNTCQVKNLLVDGTTDSFVGRKKDADGKLYNAGGIIGILDGGDTSTFNACKIVDMHIRAREANGGAIGNLRRGKSVIFDGLEVSETTFEGSHSGGAVGSIANNSSQVTALNSKFVDNTFNEVPNLWGASQNLTQSFSGGISADGRATFKFVNVLMDKNRYGDALKQGVLVGDSDGLKHLYAAGVDVIPADDQSTSKLPPMIGYRYKTNDYIAATNKKIYIAFGAYEDKLAAPTAGTKLFGSPSVKDPYVTTSPVSTIEIRSGATDNRSMYLYGDGADVALVKTIKDDANSTKAGKYTYDKIGGTSDGGTYKNSSDIADTAFSTYNANNSDSAKKATKDLGVLLVSGGDNDTVKNYLDIVTNGGYSAAVLQNANGKHVKATAALYDYVDSGEGQEGYFVKETGTDNKATLRVEGNGTSAMKFRATSDYDNDRGRITLLTVTFTEAGSSYSIQVPIIVKRMLQIDFTATYKSGTDFHKGSYAKLGNYAHVTGGYGESMTGYITWKYNSENGKLSEYGWDTYLADGASMGSLDKQLVFDKIDGSQNNAGKLPGGTQLTLVDAGDHDKSYSYKVPEGGAGSVYLKDFKDADGKNYPERWLSEIMGVTAAEDGSGTWVECDEKDNPGVRVKSGDGYTYYKKAASNETGQRYTLKVEKDSATKKEKVQSENFYLVVYIPASNETTGFNVDGNTSTSTPSLVKSNVTYTLRPGGKDGHSNTASTYRILTSYKQTLQDHNENKGRSVIPDLSADKTKRLLTIDVNDQVDYSTSQAFTDSDKLYYRLDASLAKYKNGSVSDSMSFPAGHSGTAKFYLTSTGTDGATLYWKPGATGGWSSSTNETVAATSNWNTNAGLNVTLADGDTPIDLSGLRSKVNGSFNIRMVIDDYALTLAEYEQVIAASENGTDAYTEVNYRSSLASAANGLSQSPWKASTEDAETVKYYRIDTGSSTISLVASKTSQLGINIDDLTTADGTIAAIGYYDLSKLSNVKEIMNDAGSVVYTLTLQQKGETGSYTQIDDISSYIKINEPDVFYRQSGNSFIFTDSGLETRESGTNRFVLPFSVKVDTAKDAHQYSNYRLVLTAQLKNKSGDSIDTPENINGNADYKNKDYITYELTRINTSGIAH